MDISVASVVKDIHVLYHKQMIVNPNQIIDNSKYLGMLSAGLCCLSGCFCASVIPLLSSDSVQKFNEYLISDSSELVADKLNK